MTESRYGDADFDRFAAELNRDGATLIRGLFDRSLVDAWASAFDALFRARQARLGGLAPREKNRFYLTLPWTPPFADPHVFANPVVTGVLNRVFAQEYVLVQMGADVPVQGSDYQETRRDFRPLFNDQVVTPLYAVAVNFPLVEVTGEMGRSRWRRVRTRSRARRRWPVLRRVKRRCSPTRCGRAT